MKRDDIELLIGLVVFNIVIDAALLIIVILS